MLFVHRRAHDSTQKGLIKRIIDDVPKKFQLHTKVLDTKLASFRLKIIFENVLLFYFRYALIS